MQSETTINMPEYPKFAPNAMNEYGAAVKFSCKPGTKDVVYAIQNILYALLPVFRTVNDVAECHVIYHTAEDYAAIAEKEDPLQRKNSEASRPMWSIGVKFLTLGNTSDTLNAAEAFRLREGVNGPFLKLEGEEE